MCDRKNGIASSRCTSGRARAKDGVIDEAQLHVVEGDARALARNTVRLTVKSWLFKRDNVIQRER